MMDVSQQTEFDKGLAKLQRLYPRAGETLSTCGKIRQAADPEVVCEFFEPTALIQAEGRRGARRLVMPDPVSILSWKNHISCGTRVRLTELELAIVALLGGGHTLAGMVLLRSHLEAAGMATLCLNTLTECMREGDVEPLEELIARTLFGSALFAPAKHDETVQDFLSFAQGSPVTSKALIEALEDFVSSTGGAGDWFRRTYSVLCEYAHPNLGGTSEYRSTVEDLDDGWTIRYTPTPRRIEDSVLMCLQILEACMRVGWASCAMLDFSTFRVDTERGVVYQGPSERQARSVWESFISPGSEPWRDG